MAQKRRGRHPYVTSSVASGRAVVQICCKGPDRAGTMEENRWYSAVLLAADSGPGRLCNRFGQPPAPSCPRSPTRTTAVTPHPHDEQERPVGGAPRCHHAARRGTHPANLRLLRPFPSAALLHPPMYEKKERSGGRGGAAEGKRRSRGKEAQQTTRRAPAGPRATGGSHGVVVNPGAALPRAPRRGVPGAHDPRAGSRPTAHAQAGPAGRHPLGRPA